MAQRGSVSLKAFLDSSVLFSAVNSPIGGSAKLFTLKNLDLITSTLVLTEVERNIGKKLQGYHLERFFMLVGQLAIFDKVPSGKEIKEALRATDKKDAIILASAKLIKPDIIFSLDKKHFLTNEAQEFIKPAKILTPRMFFNQNN